MSAIRDPLPLENLPESKAPGHWLLARLGKRVLRPGGLALTRQMIAALNIQQDDRVVEFAPGLGITAKMALAHHPASYTGVERDADAANHVRQVIEGENRQCVTASAHETGLPAGSATVVYGEAMLSMQSESRKLEIMREAARLLPQGGRYAIHELSLENVTPALQDEIYKDLSRALHVGATPLSRERWIFLLESAGFVVREMITAPMALLEPARVIRDEGLLRSTGILFRLLRNAEARQRVALMRSIFQKNEKHLSGVVIIAEKR